MCHTRLILPLILSCTLFLLNSQIGFSQSTPISSLGGIDSTKKEVHYLKSRKIRLPYGILDKNNLIEIRIFVSENGGNWVHYATHHTNQNYLIFRADRDGRYSFAIQQVSRGNNEEGAIYQPATKDLKTNISVIIDTLPPRASIRAIADSDGAAGVEWEVVDENLDTQSIRLEYRWEGQPDWLPFPSDRPGMYKPRDSITWEIKYPQKIEIRLKAKDRAGNLVTTPGVWTPPQSNGGSKTAMRGSSSNSGLLNPSRSTIFYVNSESFKLNTHVNVGPSGLSSLEVWVTENGDTWTQDKLASIDFTKDPQNSHKSDQLVTFNAPKDGRYGFIIIGKNRAGKGERPPKKGDLPRIEVIRDTIKPNVKIKEIKVRPNDDHGALLDIEWDANDANISPQPINIYYSTQEVEPGQKVESWKPIVEQLENSGKYTWIVPTTESYQYWIKVVAKDRAGNIGEDITKKMVIVDLTEPSVDIKDVAPTVVSPNNPIEK